MRKARPDPGVLDASAIVAAALAIADEEGLDRVSMRRLASELDVTPMALYYYVRNKEQLVDLMADQSLRKLPEIDPEGDWEAEIERYFVGLYRLFVAHPALADVMTRRPLEGPIAVGIGEQIFRLLTGAGFGDDEAVAAFTVLYNYTTGAGIYRLSRDRDSHQRLAEVSRDAAPVTYRLRKRVAAAGREKPFVTGLRGIIRSYSLAG